MKTLRKHKNKLSNTSTFFHARQRCFKIHTDAFSLDRKKSRASELIINEFARESVSRKRKGKREYLNDTEARRMMKELNGYFESKVDIPLLRHGKRQKIETLINEEVLLLAKYLRGETKTWNPIMVDSSIDYYE